MPDKTVWISDASTSGTGTGANWTAGAPESGDTAIFNGSGTANMETDITFAFPVNWKIWPASTSTLGGLTDGVPAPVQCLGGSLEMLEDPGQSFLGGPQRVFIDFGDSTGTRSIVIKTTATTGEEGMPPVDIQGTGLNVQISGGWAGFACRQGETATVDSLRMTQDRTAPLVYIGPGATLTDAIIKGGRVYSVSEQTCPALRIVSGSYECAGTGAHTLINCDGGQVVYNGSGTITQANVCGRFDLARNTVGCTITDCTVQKGGDLLSDNGIPYGANGSIAFTNAIQFPAGGILRVPPGTKVTLAAI